MKVGKFDKDVESLYVSSPYQTKKTYLAMINIYQSHEFERKYVLFTSNFIGAWLG